MYRLGSTVARLKLKGIDGEQKAMLEMAEQFLQHQLDSQCPALAAWNVVLDAHR